MKLWKEIAGIFSGFVDIIYPRTCLVCHIALNSEESHLCHKCILLLPTLGHESEEQEEMQSRFWSKLKPNDTYVFMRYDKSGPVRKLFQEIKYKGNRELAETLGQVMGLNMPQSFKDCFDSIIPVPLHKKKQKLRGFNQSEIIASGIEKSTGINVASNAVIRIKNTKTQTRLDRNQRWENVSSVFQVKDEDQIFGKNILLMDDILTTGSTLDSLAQCLLQAKPKSIGIIVMAISI